MDYEDKHPCVHESHLASTLVTTRRQAMLLAGGLGIMSLWDQSTGLAAGVQSETREGRRRKRQRRRMRHPGGALRTSQVRVANLTPQALHVSFFYQPEDGLGYGLPVTNGKTYSVFPESPESYAPGQFRIGVLIREVEAGNDVYVDMRNVSLWYPRAGVYQGRAVDPTTGRLGDVFIPEQNYSEGESHARSRVVLKRGNDSAYYIEWVVEISSGKH